MHRNPVSPRRLEFLTQLLRKKLQKTQPQLISTLLPKLQHLTEADPSPSGEYSNWILNLLIKQNIDLPEDAEKLRELLETFHRVKQRLPLEFRDINKFKSYSQLRTTLLPLLPTLKSVAELELEGNKLITTQLINKAMYQLYEITSPEAASKAAKNSGWCVCNKETAASYLKNGPLYLVMRDDERFALGHAPSSQLMDVDDVPINRGDSEHYYEDLVRLLQQHLPALICPNHPSGILNRGCNTCSKTGCEECGFMMCAGDGCDNDMCPDHGDECVDCEKSFCSECQAGCCTGSNKCKECSYRCAKCDTNLCDECGKYADCCETIFCDNHIGDYCGSCERLFCNWHGSTVNCNKCHDSFCEECLEGGIICSDCGEYSCSDCLGECSCGNKFCNDCAVDCVNCDESICDDCRSYCRKCDENYCPQCEEVFRCEGSNNQEPHHAHGSYSNCWPHVEDEDADDFARFCDDCINTCFRCRNAVCDKCSDLCECGRGHYLCEKCNTICPVCNNVMCSQEEHLQCAYTRRRRYRS